MNVYIFKNNNETKAFLLNSVTDNKLDENWKLFYIGGKVKQRPVQELTSAEDILPILKDCCPNSILPETAMKLFQIIEKNTDGQELEEIKNNPLVKKLLKSEMSKHQIPRVFAKG